MWPSFHVAPFPGGTWLNVAWNTSLAWNATFLISAVGRCKSQWEKSPKCKRRSPKDVGWQWLWQISSARHDLEIGLSCHTIRKFLLNMKLKKRKSCVWLEFFHCSNNLLNSMHNSVIQWWAFTSLVCPIARVLHRAPRRDATTLPLPAFVRNTFSSLFLPFLVCFPGHVCSLFSFCNPQS